MKFLKGALIFLLGSGVGASASYLYFKKLYDEKREELVELQEHYTKKLDKEIDKDITTSIIKQEEYVSYDKLNEEEIKTVIKEREIEAIALEAPSEDYPEEPIIITESDYQERELYFDKLEVDYYVEDESLVDENDELVNIADSIGYDNLEGFIADEKEDIMYIRNSANSSDYMVRKVFGKFSDVVGVGGDDEDE